MHAPRPYGRFAEQAELSEEDAAFIANAVRSVTNFKTISGLESLKRTFTLPSGREGAVIDMGGTLRAIVYEKHESPEFVPDGTAITYIPMLFSGTIEQGLAKDGEPIPVRFTKLTQRRLTRYGKDDRGAPSAAELVRFNCRLPAHLGQMAGTSGLGPLMTQYFRCRPSWWAGAMAQVVQIVGGYGRQDLTKLPKDRIERAEFRVPEKYMRKIRRELGNKRLPGYTGMPPEDGEFTYDFQFARTHGVSFDDSGAPWLVQVSKKGVYAMPLPTIPATTTDAFREYVEDVGDTEILWALDRFGGLPSGESFPSDDDGFEAWRRAGVIIKVCDTTAFYEHDAIGSAIGWAFNSSGTEGFNTATGFDEGAKIPYAVGFQLRLRMGKAKDRGLVPLDMSSIGLPRQQRLSRYLADLFGALTANKDRERAIKYKIRRMSLSELEGRAGNKGASDVDYWDNKELEPIAVHEGSCSEVSRGFIYPTLLGAFKIPDPLFEGCISHSVEGLYPVEIPDKYPRCDTIVYGYYVGDDLKVVKYFYDDREVNRIVESTFEDCMIVGEWHEKIYSDKPRIAGNLYTTDFDGREEVSNGYKLTTVTGSEIGYTMPSVNFHAIFAMDATVTRNKYYGKVTNIKSSSGETKQVCCYVPFMMRNAVVYGSVKHTETFSEKESAALGSVQDPNVYDAWLFDGGSHWSGGGRAPKTSPQPSNVSPPNIFWVEVHRYEPTDCNAWADEGPFIPDLPADYTWLLYQLGGHPHSHIYAAPAPPFNSYDNKSISEIPPEDTHLMGLSLNPAAAVLPAKVTDFHFTRSPDTFMNVFYHDACKVEAGIARYAWVSEPATGGTRFGYTVMANQKSAQHFIGVINE